MERTGRTNRHLYHQRESSLSQRQNQWRSSMQKNNRKRVIPNHAQIIVEQVSIPNIPLSGKLQIQLGSSDPAISPQSPPSRKFLETLRDWIGIISASTGIFVVLLYLAGR